MAPIVVYSCSHTDNDRSLGDYVCRVEKQKK